jgi:hypothetical protein
MITHPIRVLSLIPPMTQLNTPYPSTAYLTGFLRSRGFDAVQEDLAIALVLKLFPPMALQEMRVCTEAIPEARKRSPTPTHFSRSLTVISLRSRRPSRSFCRGRDPTLAHRICGYEISS